MTASLLDDTQVRELVAFWTARLDDTAETARATSALHWVEDGHGGGVWALDSNAPIAVAAFRWMGEDATHIVAHDPAAVLRDVERHRTTVARLLAVLDSQAAVWSGDWQDPYQANTRGHIQALTDVIARHAADHSDHPDYRPEWAPS